MKNYTLLILLISFIYPRRDCLQQRELDRLGRPLGRPDEIQDSTLSPKGHFYIHYDTTETNLHEAGPPDLTDLNLNGVPDYIDEVGAIADSARKVLVEVMGYQRAPFDTDSIYDIYIMEYPKYKYGFNYTDNDLTADQNQENGESSYLCIDNDFIPHSLDVDISPLDIMRITLVHEYFHAIQWGYGSDTNSNAYFYEMSSMWFEDVMIPAGNDYLGYSWIKDLFDHPTRAFNNTGQGYELALFGHYLSSFIDPKGQMDAKQSTIMLEIWSRFSDCTDFYSHSECNNRGAFYAVEDILEESYNTTFIESWVDFISRNLYNGIDESFYYYSDQALIDPIQTGIDPQTLDDRDTLILSLDNKSAAIQSYQLGESGLLGIDHLSADYVGRFSILSTSDYNDLFVGSDMYGLELTSGSDIHFVYGSETQESVTIDIIYNPSCGIVEGASVWPGDTNADNLVNIDDILPIGVYWSQNHPEAQICKRSIHEDSLYQWSEQPLLHNMFLGDNCISHADANGDGKVDIADILPIMINWEYETSNNGNSDTEDGSCIVVTDTEDLSRYHSNFSQIYNSLTGNSNAEVQIRSRLEELFGFSSAPSIFQIYQNYPNPFNSITSIPYYLSSKSEVSLAVFDLLGRQVIQDGPFIMPKGPHKMIINGQNLTSGVYLYQYRINGTELMPKKMVLLK